MGAGRSRSSSYSNFLESGSNSDIGVDEKEFNKLRDHDTGLFKNKSWNTSFGKLNENLVKELKDLGVEVIFGDEFSKTLRDVRLDNIVYALGVSDKEKESVKKEILWYAETLNKNGCKSINELKFKGKTKEVAKFESLKYLGDLGVRKLSSLEAEITQQLPIGSKMSWGSSDDDSAGFYNNAALYKLKTLVKIAKSKDMNLDYINFSFSPSELNRYKNVRGFYTTLVDKQPKSLGLNIVSDDLPWFSSGNNSAFTICSGLLGGTTVHEFGHFIEDSYNAHNGRKGTDRALSTVIASKSKKSEAVSMYGNTNSKEAFAEAFTAYCFLV